MAFKAAAIAVTTFILAISSSTASALSFQIRSDRAIAYECDDESFKKCDSAGPLDGVLQREVTIEGDVATVREDRHPTNENIPPFNVPCGREFRTTLGDNDKIECSFSSDAANHTIRLRRTLTDDMHEYTTLEIIRLNASDGSCSMVARSSGMPPITETRYQPKCVVRQ